MSTTLSIPRRVSSRRTQALAGATALVAAASVAVTLAVAGGGGDQATTLPSPAQPSVIQPAQSGGAKAAERFHHFRGQPSVAQPEQSGGASAAERFHHFR
jgi:hypothetical protein